MKILLASDGSPSSDAAVAEVARRPWPQDSEIKVLTAFGLPVSTQEHRTIPAAFIEEMDLLARNSAQSIVARATEQLKAQLGDSVVVKGEFASGSPKAVILEEANRWGADLIVMGSHGYQAWERLLLGSISQAVVSQAKCSVEVVRMP